MKEEGKITGWWGALLYMILGFLKEIVFTIFSTNTIRFDAKGPEGRVGLTRSAMWLFMFLIVHAVGNLHVFLGPNDFNGYGYFYVRLYPTGDLFPQPWNALACLFVVMLGFCTSSLMWPFVVLLCMTCSVPANIVELYVALGVVMHVLIALKRTWESSIHLKVDSGAMNLAFSGILLLVFMTIHLFQFRFGATRPFSLCPPPYFINIEGIPNFFWVESCTNQVPVRDIYRLEFELFNSGSWTLFYVLSVLVFSTHMCLGWKKCVPAPSLEIPKRYHNRAVHLGYIMTAFIALVYLSFPLFAYMDNFTDGCSPVDQNSSLVFDYYKKKGDVTPTLGTPCYLATPWN